MKLRPYKYAFLLICWVLLCSLSVSAQEGRSQTDNEPAIKDTPRNEPDPILNSESESRINKVTPPPAPAPAKETVRDSLQVNQAKITKPTTKAVEKDQKGEDPLSFNFLYYIIERFKLSDIIE